MDGGGGILLKAMLNFKTFKKFKTSMCQLLLSKAEPYMNVFQHEK